MDRLDRIINFAKEAEKFSHIKRAIYNSNGEKESDSEHTFQMTLLLALIEKDLPKVLDFNRMIKLILVHDLPEIYAGDSAFSDVTSRENKKQTELKAAEKLFSKLPEDLEKEFMGLFLEYNNISSREVKVVKALKFSQLFQRYFQRLKLVRN